MNQSEYLTEMYSILDDQLLFHRFETDMTIASEERLTNHLRRMKKEKLISDTGTKSYHTVKHESVSFHTKNSIIHNNVITKHWNQSTIHYTYLSIELT